MTIDYPLMVYELREDLENLAQKDGEFTAKACKGLKDGSELKLRHRKYVSALNDALKTTAKRYQVEYKPISEKLSEPASSGAIDYSANMVD